MDDEEEFEPECECIQIDVDLMDARWCPAHGPSSEMAKRQRRQEAEDEAKFWSNVEPWW